MIKKRSISDCILRTVYTHIVRDAAPLGADKPFKVLKWQVMLLFYSLIWASRSSFKTASSPKWPGALALRTEFAAFLSCSCFGFFFYFCGIFLSRLFCGFVLFVPLFSFCGVFLLHLLYVFFFLHHCFAVHLPPLAKRVTPSHQAKK